MNTAGQSQSASFLHSETLLPVGLLGVLVIMLIPLPPFLLDLLLAGNLSLTILLLLVTMGAKRALDLSVFPSLLLLLTLYRLSLNVATTRLILLSADAGKLVQAFGDFVVGGDLIVGLVIFLILVVIQFVVITKGAGRISEVAARFTLDALPGKQMSIDAELNAGTIDEKQAKSRREKLAQETEFYGAMDGASKFVRGDAIAGMIITAINLLGGMVLGVTHGMSMIESLHQYSILTVGDGLITQIPALIIAVTAGILVTKTTSDETLGEEIETQLFRNERPLWIAVIILGLLALMPGIPKVPFISLGIGLLLFLFWRPSKSVRKPSASPDGEHATPAGSVDDLDEYLMRDRAMIELGPQLISLLNPPRGKTLSERITTLRKDFAKERGIQVSPIRVRSQLQIPAQQYRILISGRVVASGEIQPDKMLAIVPENSYVEIPGEKTQEPAFQLPAKWIEPSLETQAKSHRYTVVDAASVLMTHLGEVLKQHGHELLTRESLKEMLDQVREFAPTIVDELKSESIRMSVLHQVLQQLAEEDIPLSDLALILESVSNHAHQHKTPNELTDAVRTDLRHLICDKFVGDSSELRVIVFEPQLENRLRESLQENQLAISPQPLESLLKIIRESQSEATRLDRPVALLVDRTLRRPIRKLLQRAAPRLGIVAYQEVPGELGLEPVRIVMFSEIFLEATLESSENQVMMGAA